PYYPSLTSFPVCSHFSLFSSIPPPPPSSTLFPYSTLFRSRHRVGGRHLHPWRELEELPQRGRHELDPAGQRDEGRDPEERDGHADRKSTRLNSSHLGISYAVFCLKKKKKKKKNKSRNKNKT